MKGVIFRTFIDFVEAQMGDEMVDRMIEETKPKSGGAYTSVGTYDHNELVDMIGFLHNETKLPVLDMIKAYSHELFKHLASYHANMVSSYKHAFDMLEELDGVIHVQVKKLYPDAQLPRIFIESRDSDKQLVLRYESERPFAGVAEGLIESTIKQFGGGYDLAVETILDDNTKARFTLTKA